MSLETNLTELQPWLKTYLDRLSPQSRKQLLRQLGTGLRQVNQKRMTAQTDPDGQIWEARKQQPHHDKKQNRKKLFLRLRQARRLRTKVFSDSLRVGFSGRAARIARIHHYGLREQLKYGPANYPARELIGINDIDRQMIEKMITNHIAGEQ